MGRLYSTCIHSKTFFTVSIWSSSLTTDELLKPWSKCPHTPKHLTGSGTGAVQVGHCFGKLALKMTILQKQLDSHCKGLNHWHHRQIRSLFAYMRSDTHDHAFCVLQRSRRMEHQPADGGLFPLSLRQFRACGCCPEPAPPSMPFFQELLHWRVHPFSDSSVSACLWKGKENLNNISKKESPWK